MERTSWLMFESPELGKHWSDEMVFLRTFQFMKTGEHYYDAVERATKEDGKITSYSTSDVFTWRMPTIFYLWSFVANDGVEIGITFIVLSACSLLSIYFIVRKCLGPLLSLCSPLFLFPYFLDAFHYGPSFLSTEWWGLFFFIPGLCALLYKKTTTATIFLSLAVITRELFIIPAFSLFFVSLWLKTNRVVFANVLFVFFTLFLVHFSLIQQRNIVKVANNPFARIHSLSKILFQREVAFSMRLYPLLEFKLPLFLFFISTSTLVVKIIMKHENSLYLLSSYLPFATLSIFTGGIYNNYWGILFMPLAIAFAPIALSLKKKS